MDGARRGQRAARSAPTAESHAEEAGLAVTDSRGFSNGDIHARP